MAESAGELDKKPRAKALPKKPRVKRESKDDAARETAAPKVSRSKKAKATKPAPKEPEPTYTCQYCNQVFKREKSLSLHSCEKRRRWLSRDERSSRVGFMAFQTFTRLWLRRHRETTFEDFANSQYYTGLIKFGRHLENIVAIEPLGFVEFLIKRNVALHNWCNDVWYETWIRELSAKEPLMTALERNLKLMDQWALEFERTSTDFFREVETTLAVDWIKRGRISPWLLYSRVGSPLIDRMTDTQLLLVCGWFDPKEWSKRIRANQTEVDKVLKTLTEIGM